MRAVFFLLLTAGLLVSRPRLAAQNMNMPYSVYGIGDIDSRPYNRTSGMAGTGLATRSSFYLIDNNPAAITGLTRSFYLLDMAMTGKTVTYTGDPVNVDNSTAKDFWIKRLALAVKVNGFWATSAGFRQFSHINYTFTGQKEIEGSTTTYQTYYEGDGGLNEYYWTNAVSLGKHLSLGLRTSIIAGAVNRIETVADAGLGTSIATKVQEYYGRPRLQGGLLYERPVSRQWTLAVGGRAAPRVSMPAEKTLSVAEGSTLLVDALSLKSQNFSLPNSYAVGFAAKNRDKTTYAVDYSYEDWSALKIKQQGWQLVSSQRLSAGVEFSQKRVQWNQLVEKRFFQAGAFYHQTYLQIRNEPVKEFGLTAGMGGLIGNGLLYTLSLEGGSRGTTRQKLIKENYFQLNLSLSYRDLLMSRGRKYY